jgi:hypothetical protein
MSVLARVRAQRHHCGGDDKPVRVGVLLELWLVSACSRGDTFEPHPSHTHETETCGICTPSPKLHTRRRCPSDASRRSSSHATRRFASRAMQLRRSARARYKRPFHLNRLRHGHRNHVRHLQYAQASPDTRTHAFATHDPATRSRAACDKSAHTPRTHARMHALSMRSQPSARAATHTHPRRTRVFSRA